MQAYMDAVSGLGRRLLRVIALALSLPEDFFQAYFDKPLAFLRPLHYSAQVSLPEEVTPNSPPLCNRLPSGHGSFPWFSVTLVL